MCASCSYVNAVDCDSVVRMRICRSYVRLWQTIYRVDCFGPLIICLRVCGLLTLCDVCMMLARCIGVAEVVSYNKKMQHRSELICDTSIVYTSH